MLASLRLDPLPDLPTSYFPVLSHQTAHFHIPPKRYKNPNNSNKPNLPLAPHTVPPPHHFFLHIPYCPHNTLAADTVVAVGSTCPAVAVGSRSLVVVAVDILAGNMVVGWAHHSSLAVRVVERLGVDKDQRLDELGADTWVVGPSPTNGS